jgi:DNA-binding transcriptional LysR family regulator
MSIRLDLLKTFVVFSQSSSIMVAARKLGLSQPAVSVQLASLARALPHPLFTHEGRKKTLTHYGRALAEELARKLGALEKGLEQVNRMYSNAENLHIRIGARPELFARIAGHIRFPGSVEVIALGNTEAMAKLLSHDIDLAIAHDRPNLSTIHARRIFAESCRMVVHRDLIGGKKLTPERARDPEFLTKTPFLAYKADPPFLGDWLKPLGLQVSAIRIGRICEDWRGILKFAELGQGYTIIPRGFPSSTDELASLDLPTEIVPEVIFYAIFHEDLRRIPALKEYLKF